MYILQLVISEVRNLKLLSLGRTGFPLEASRQASAFLPFQAPRDDLYSLVHDPLPMAGRVWVMSHHSDTVSSPSCSHI